MTNREILNRHNVIQQALQQDVFEGTKIRYALTSNSKRLERALEAYQDQLEDLQSEFEEQLQELQSEQQEIQAQMEEAEGENLQELQEEMQELEAPQVYREKRDELLSMDAGEVKEYNVSDSYLDGEEDVPAQYLYELDWMFVDSVQ